MVQRIIIHLIYPIVTPKCQKFCNGISGWEFLRLRLILICSCKKQCSPITGTSVEKGGLITYVIPWQFRYLRKSLQYIPTHIGMASFSCQIFSGLVVYIEKGCIYTYYIAVFRYKIHAYLKNGCTKNKIHADKTANKNTVDSA